MQEVSLNLPPRPNLVVVRAGERSLHPRWLNRSYEARTFDLVVSYFSEAAYARHKAEPGVRAVLIRGGKWDGLFNTLTTLPELDRYDYVWLPDDDIATDGETIDRMFDLARNYELAVCQPALTRDSYFSHFIFSQCRAFRLRYVNHVEIMVPCLNRALLKRALPYFEGTMSGFGLDYIWCRWPESGPFRAAILDDIAVHHTRPIGSQLKGAINSAGSRAQDEEGVLRARVGLNKGRVVPLAYAGITIDGKSIDRQVAMGWTMFRSWLSDLGSFRDSRLALKKTLQVLKRQHIKHLDLGLLEDGNHGGEAMLQCYRIAPPNSPMKN
ncbi:hypothetical protein [Rhizobium sp. LC145]|uniref:hypothetical protein n=1 Tax=Rhizobium sp. LC145 TaxID=1120688 RepID=UPI0006995188|nr:hypothetical protein [Rhizobium sp. LC145]TKT55921.1 hypothetical protein FDR95_16810 [Rhizobiaceae bacterium LC148]